MRATRVKTTFAEDVRDVQDEKVSTAHEIFSWLVLGLWWGTLEAFDTWEFRVIDKTSSLGAPVMPFFFSLSWGEGSPTKIDYRKKGTLILTPLLEDLEVVANRASFFCMHHKPSVVSFAAKLWGLASKPRVLGLWRGPLSPTLAFV